MFQRECGKIMRVRERERTQDNYSGSPSHPIKEFTMLDTLLQAILPQDPLTIFLTYTR
jgi:hypothetical protein